VERRLKKQTTNPPDMAASLDDGSLMTAMSQLAWEKDIDLTKGTAFTKVDAIQEDATRTSSPGDQTPLLKDGANVKSGMGTAKVGTQYMAPPTGSRQSGDGKTNAKMHTAKVHPNDLKPGNAGVKGKDLATSVTVGKDGIPKYPRKKPHAKGPPSRPSSAKSSSGGSKDSTFVNEGTESRGSRRTNLALTGSKSSLNSASSLTSLLLASDSKDAHKKQSKNDSTEF
jgi:hypothetical protein